MPEKPNVLLLAVDTLRADHLGCYGYPCETSPNVDRWLAGQGVLFEHHCTQASYTHPAYTTIFTGHYPLRHRSIFMPTKVPPPEGMPMLAELLRAGGYYTVSVSRLPFPGQGPGAFYGRGFDSCLNYGTERATPPLDREGGPEGKPSGMHCVNRITLPLLRELQERQPFFLFLHVWDPHRPYTPRRPFSERFVTGREPNTVNFSVVIPTSRGKEVYPQEPSGVEYTVAQYDGAVADFDQAFGEIMEEMERLSYVDDTLLILTADHGESLGEHRIYFRHAGAFEPTMHVPLILRYPPRLPKGRRRPQLTEHVDIAPTVLAFAGVKGAKGMAGLDLTDVALGEPATTREVAFGHTPNPDLRRSARTERYKFIQHIKGCPREEAWPEEELYDLASDPGENHNLIREQPDIAKRMRGLLEEWVRRTLAGRPDPMVEQGGGEGTVSRWPFW